MYRLEAEVNEQIEPLKKAPASGLEVRWSDVFGTNIRMRSDPREESGSQPEQQRPASRLQWWNEGWSRWLDRQTNAEVEQETRRRHARKLQESLKEGEARGREPVQTDMTVGPLHKFLFELSGQPLDQIAAAWRRDGAPADAVGRIPAVRQAPHEWRSLLRPYKPGHDIESLLGPIPLPP